MIGRNKSKNNLIKTVLIKGSNDVIGNALAKILTENTNPLQATSIINLFKSYGY